MKCYLYHFLMLFIAVSVATVPGCGEKSLVDDNGRGDAVSDSDGDTDSDGGSDTNENGACSHACVVIGQCVKLGGSSISGDECPDDKPICCDVSAGDGDSDADLNTCPDGDVAGDGVFVIAASQAPNVPTVAIVEWSVNVVVDAAYIEFGLDESYGMEAPIAESDGPDFRTLLLGMKADRDYHYNIVVTSDGQTYESGDQSHRSGPTLTVRGPTIEEQQPEKTADGFLVVATFNGGGVGQNPMALIWDKDGDLVWGMRTRLSDSSSAKMSWDGKWIAVVPTNNQGGSGSIDLFSMDGEVSKNFKETGASHDITANDDNTFAFIEYTAADGDETRMASVCARVQEIDLDGNKSLIFDSAQLWGDNCHGNALRFSADTGFYTLSDLNHSQIAVFDKAGNVQWVTQNNGIWQTQHGHQLLADTILVFDNGGSFSMGGGAQSTALEFAYDLNGHLIKIWEYSSSGLGTPTLGDIQRLPNGNTLVTYSNSAISHEVDSSANLVRRWDFGATPIGYVAWRPTLYGPPADTGM